MVRTTGYMTGQSGERQRFIDMLMNMGDHRVDFGMSPFLPPMLVT